MREIKRGESVMKSKPSSETPWLTADTRKFVKALEKQGGPPLYKLAIPDARQVLLDAQSGKIKAPAVESEDLKIPLGSGSVGVRLVRPVIFTAEAGFSATAIPTTGWSGSFAPEPAQRWRLSNIHRPRRRNTRSRSNRLSRCCNIWPSTPVS